MRLLIYLFFSLFAQYSMGQNLVVNPSFEDTISKNSSQTRAYNSLYHAEGWRKIQSVDYFWYGKYAGPDKGFRSYQKPNTGACYAGMIMQRNDGYQEHLVGVLSDELNKGCNYKFSLFVNMDYFGKTVANEISVLFCEKPIKNPKTKKCGERMSVSTKENTGGWIQKEFEFTAKGGERYFAIGSIVPEIYTRGNKNRKGRMCNGVYLCIDDVALTLVSDCEILAENEIATPIIIDTLPTLIENVFYDTDAIDIAFKYYSDLDSLADFMINNNWYNLEIVGYADGVGSENYNRSLALKRARIVSKYLISKGVSNNRLMLITRGKRGDKESGLLRKVTLTIQNADKEYHEEY